MGGIGNVVVNTIVRMFTKKAVGKAMKTAKPAGGKKGTRKAGERKKGASKGEKDG
jgi:hypothetical protein